MKKILLTAGLLTAVLLGHVTSVYASSDSASAYTEHDRARRSVHISMDDIIEETVALGADAIPYVSMPDFSIRNLTPKNKDILGKFFGRYPHAVADLNLGLEDGFILGRKLILKEEHLPENIHNLIIKYHGDYPLYIGNSFLQGFDLKSIDLSGLRNLRQIGDFFLYECNELTSINLEGLNSLEKIGNYFLAGCVRLQSLDFRPLSSLTSIGDYFLFGCGGITLLTTVAEVPYVGDSLTETQAGAGAGTGTGATGPLPGTGAVTGAWPAGAGPWAVSDARK